MESESRIVDWKDLVLDEDEERYYIGDEEEPFNGIAREYFKNGHLSAESRFEEGRQMGLDQMWYENGALRESRCMMGDCIHGDFRMWYQNGQLKQKATYEFGVCVSAIDFNESGVETDRFEICTTSANFELLQLLRKKWNQLHRT